MSKMKDKAIDQMNEDPDSSCHTVTRAGNVSERNLRCLTVGQVFKLRDSVGLIHAILGHGDMTLDMLASLVQKEIDRRTNKGE